MRENFGKGYIEEELRSLGGDLEQDTEVYLIGGGAMSFMNLKDATKDVDLVVTKTPDMSRLVDALLENGYYQVKNPDTQYEELGASAIVENREGCRFDIFDRRVANKLIFSDCMRRRSGELLGSGSLAVNLTSPEDIFLFKSVAKRTADVDDMRTLVQTGLDFDVIKSEIENQSKLIGEDRFITHIAESVEELRERHGVTIPLSGYISERSREAYDQIEVLMVLREGGSVSRKKLIENVEIDEDRIDETVSRLEELGRVERDGDVIREA